jgi:AbrB family looped-hinge helix DNA binding protein
MYPPRAKVGERGQLTIPKRLRSRLGIVAGEEIAFEERDGALVLRRAASSDPLEGLVGLLPERIDVDAYLERTRGPAWRAARDARKKGRARPRGRRSRR